MKLRQSRLRIIAGRWRGRRLEFPDSGGVRPTPERVRETLFNWLSPVITGSRCLDLFAGSGALGIEALSRGAAKTVLVERDPHLVKAIRNNLSTLGSDDAQVIHSEALSWLARPASPFQIVFLDPPFHQQLLEPVIEQLMQGWLATDALIYVESARGETPHVPASWQLQREKTAGEVRFRLFQSHLAS